MVQSMAKLKALWYLITIPFVECCIIILLTSTKIHLQVDDKQMFLAGQNGVQVQRHMQFQRLVLIWHTKLKIPRLCCKVWITKGQVAMLPLFQMEIQTRRGQHQVEIKQWILEQCSLLPEWWSEMQKSNGSGEAALNSKDQKRSAMMPFFQDSSAYEPDGFGSWSSIVLSFHSFNILTQSLIMDMKHPNYHEIQPSLFELVYSFITTFWYHHNNLMSRPDL